nr:hypothetical protein [Protofrankia symbiont of Coriaria ruscifolia]
MFNRSLVIWSRSEDQGCDLLVCVVGRFLDGQAAEAVGQRLGDSAGPLFGPGGFGRRAVEVEDDPPAVDVDLVDGFPAAADGGVVQSLW